MKVQAKKFKTLQAMRRKDFLMTRRRTAREHPPQTRKMTAS